MKLAVYCAGGFGREIYDLAQRINHIENRWKDIVFIDNYKSECFFEDVGLFAMKDLPYKPGEIEIIIANGEPAEREIIYKELQEYGYEITTLVDPLAVISPNAHIGKGSIVIGYTMVNSFATIGENVVLQSHCVIGHDVCVGNHCVLSSGFMPSGKTKIGERVFLGLNTCTIDGVEIGDDAVIGMGAVVHRNVEPNMIVMGNPARPIRKNEDKKVFNR